MSDVYGPMPDWRSADAYRPLLDADPAVWAWEFGRRGQGVDADLCFAGPGPMDDPTPAVLWRWRADPKVPVLSVARASKGEPDALDIQALDLAVLVVRSDDDEQHVLVSDGARRLRFAVVEGDVLAGSVCCQVRLPTQAAGPAGLESLRLLIGLRDTGALVGSVGRGAVKTARWLQALRAHDARRAGASQREIATLLFGEARVREDWNGGSDYMRMRVQRLVRAAEALTAGGYRTVFGLGRSGVPAGRTREIWRSPAWRAGR